MLISLKDNLNLAPFQFFHNNYSRTPKQYLLQSVENNLLESQLIESSFEKMLHRQGMCFQMRKWFARELASMLVKEDV